MEVDMRGAENDEPEMLFRRGYQQDARSSAELAVKHDSWSKVCGQAARRLRPKVRRWRWTMREGDGQPLRLLADLTGPVLESQLHGQPQRRPRPQFNLRLGHRTSPKTTRATGIVVMIL